MYLCVLLLRKPGKPTHKPTKHKRQTQTPNTKRKRTMTRTKRTKAAYTYQVNLAHGRKYIGMAYTKESLKRRIRAQLDQAPSASSVCRSSQVLSVSKVWKHPNASAAKAAETKRYYSTKALLGKTKVRGAGHTKPF